MNALTDTLTVLGTFLILALPALVGYAHEWRIDRQLRAAVAHRSGQASASTERGLRGLTTHDVARAA